MKTVLIVDDEPDVAELLKLAVEEGFSGINCSVELDFSQSADHIARLRPDAIVLDLMLGHESVQLPGEGTWKSVWESSFCPIVIYTGTEAGLKPPVPENHPFVKRISKGNGTEALVVDALRSFSSSIEAVRRLRTEVDAVIHKVLRDTVGDGHMCLDDSSYLLHAGRRRIAATMDDPTIIGNRSMASWEQYLIPAIGISPLTADVLRVRDAQWDDPKAYRLILTPSCDLVAGRCESTLTVACCEGTTRLAQKLSLSLSPKRLAKDTETVIIKALSTGVCSGFLPLPSFPSRLPVMVANLKGLEVISWDSVGPADSTTHRFVRVASIDSPFREQVAWAYLTTAARPGMPDRELGPWAEELVNAACTS
jgi:CheY-like chemotaxis protein